VSEKNRYGEEPENEETAAGGDQDGPAAHSEAAGAGAADSEEGSEECGKTWNPWNSFAEIQETVSDFVDTAVRGVSPFTARHPRYDLVRLPDEGYRILMDLPGVQKSALQVTTLGDELTVSGERARPELPDGSEVLRTERGYGRFQRSIRIPADADPALIKAKLEHGVLRVTLSRKSESSRQSVEVED
jgi:HSP20 family protein